MNEREKNSSVQNSKPSFKRNKTMDIVALVLCLVAAFLLWLFVANTNRTVVEKTVIVTVDAKTQIEEATVREDGTFLSIINGKDTTDFSQLKVTLKVSGTQALLDRYSDDDYKISIQTEPIKKGGSGKYTVRFNDPELPNEGLTLNSMEPAYFEAFVDELYEKEVKVTASAGVGGVSEGTLESITPVNIIKDGTVDKHEKMETVKISGPKSIIGDIDCVDVKVSIENYSKSMTVKSQTFEFFAGGVKYSNDNNYITVEPSEVDVDLVIKYSDKPVSINWNYEPPADINEYNYIIKASFSGSTDAAEIRLSGESKLFDKKIEYNLGNITDKTGTSFTIAVADLKIPEGFTVNAEDMAKFIAITITKEKIVPEENTTVADSTIEAPDDATPDNAPAGDPA